MIEVDVAWEHGSGGSEPRVRRLTEAVRAIVGDYGLSRARVSLAVVDDATIHEMNRRYLEHDYATDVLSFLLERDEDWLEGEVVVSWDTASRLARQLGWAADDELLLYVIHGTLHLVGEDDQQPAQRQRMRELETQYLARWELVPPATEARDE